VFQCPTTRCRPPRAPLPSVGKDSLQPHLAPQRALVRAQWQQLPNNKCCAGACHLQGLPGELGFRVFKTPQNIQKGGALQELVISEASLETATVDDDCMICIAQGCRYKACCSTSFCSLETPLLGSATRPYSLPATHPCIAHGCRWETHHRACWVRWPSWPT
jgi:hypothetical protein